MLHASESGGLFLWWLRVFSISLARSLFRNIVLVFFQAGSSSCNLYETRTMVIYNRKHMNFKITTYNIVFQTVEINHSFSKRKFQYLLWIFTTKNIKTKYNRKRCDLKMDFATA